jgi:hypothetical protein
MLSTDIRAAAPEARFGLTEVKWSIYPFGGSECALRRQTPEVGAESPNWARSELSGGRSETSVPAGNNTKESQLSIYCRAGGPC